MVNFNFLILINFRCKQCAAFGCLQAPSEQDALIYNQHVQNAHEVQMHFRADRVSAEQNNTHCIASFDFHKVVTTPQDRSPYLSSATKLCIYNFMIHETTNDEGTCYIWNETVAPRESIEVASLVHNFIREKASRGITDFTFYTDIYKSNNRNKQLYSMYLQAANQLWVNITHR